MTKLENITLALNQIFHNQERVSNKRLKEAIQQVYDQNGWHYLKAKGTDIRKFGFSTKKCKIRVDDKRVDGVILTKITI